MNVNQVGNTLTTGCVFAAVVVLGFLSGTSRVQADDGEGDAEQSRIRRGFEIAPVPLNLQGKNRELVGLGSYLVNAAGDCSNAGALTVLGSVLPARHECSAIRLRMTSPRSPTSAA